VSSPVLSISGTSFVVGVAAVPKASAFAVVVFVCLGLRLGLRALGRALVAARVAGRLRRRRLVFAMTSSSADRAAESGDAALAP